MPSLNGPFLISATNNALAGGNLQSHVAYDPTNDLLWCAVGSTIDRYEIDVFYSADEGVTWTKDTSRSYRNATSFIDGNCAIGCSDDGVMVLAVEVNTVHYVMAALDSSPGGGWDGSTSKTEGATTILSVEVVPDPGSAGDYLVSVDWTSGVQTQMGCYTLTAAGVVAQATPIWSVANNVGNNVLPAVEPVNARLFFFDNRNLNGAAEGWSFATTDMSTGGSGSRVQCSAATGVASWTAIAYDYDADKVYGIGFYNAAPNDYIFYRADAPGLTNVTAMAAPGQTGAPAAPQQIQLVKVSADKIMALHNDNTDDRWVYAIYTISTDTWTSWSIFAEDMENLGTSVVRWPYRPSLVVLSAEGYTLQNPDEFLVATHDFNTAPTAPTLTTLESASKGGPIDFDWVHNDADGDPQSAYALVRKRVP